MRPYYFLLFFIYVSISEAMFLDRYTRTPNKTLTVDNGGPWGNWRYVTFCPEGTFAVGYKMKIEGNQFTGDDTSLDAIKLRCGDLHGNGYIADIESDEGDWGQWTALISCKTHAGVDASHDFITAFQLQVEGDQGSGDDTAANYMNARCRDIASDSGEYEIDKTDTDKRGLWGDFGDWSESCQQDSAVCGIQVKLEGSQGDRDDTSLNDIKLFCCGINE